MRKIAYLSMDVHARNCVLGDMDANGKFRGNRSFTTSENNIINTLKAVKTKRKYLVIEAGPLSNWAAQVANVDFPQKSRHGQAQSFTFCFS